jgi:DNA-binding MarR family transcriptional regulator
VAVFHPNESLGHHCNLTRKAFASAVEQELKGSGMSPAQYLALAQLIASGSMSQSELVGRLYITRATGARLVDRMERDGWVVRRRDPKDDRVKLVVPTERAAQVWERLSHVGRTVVDRAHRGIDPEELEMAKTIMARVRANLIAAVGSSTKTARSRAAKRNSRGTSG